MLNFNYDTIILQAKGQEFIEDNAYFSCCNKNSSFLYYIIDDMIISCLDLGVYINCIWGAHLNHYSFNKLN